MESIGERVRKELSHAGFSQKDLSDKIGISPDALSRALNGHRGFSAIEVAQAAAVLGVDVHYLITGEPDPMRLVLSARHSYDHSSGDRAVKGLEADMRILEDIKLVYAQALA